MGKKDEFEAAVSAPPEAVFSALEKFVNEKIGVTMTITKATDFVADARSRIENLDAAEGAAQIKGGATLLVHLREPAERSDSGQPTEEMS